MSILRHSLMLAASVGGIGFAGAFAPVQARSATAQQETADVVLVGGDVRTMDKRGRRASAIALRGDSIVAVGSDRRVMRLRGPETRVVNLRGRTVLPGFIDTHIHSIVGSLEFGKCSIGDQSLEPEQLRVKVLECDASDRAAGKGAADWLEVVGVNPSGLTLRASDIDRWIADRPVVLRGSDYHSAWVNSRAMADAKITGASIDPAGGVIERDSGGQPTGFLKDPPAIELALNVIPKPTLPDRRKRLAQAFAQHLSHGITTIFDPKTGEEELSLYAAMLSDGAAPLTIHAGLTADISDKPEEYARLQGLRQRFNGLSPRLIVDTVKVLPDGAIEYPTQTAAMLDPYRDTAGHLTENRGQRYFDPAEFARFVTRIEQLGFRLHVHAIGDYTVRASLDAITAARDANGKADRRHAITHLQVVSPADLPRFAKLGVIANMQLHWAIGDDYTIKAVQPYVSKEAFRYMYPAQSLVRAGATLVGSSDWPVSTDDPLEAMRHAMTRRAAPDAPTLNVEERIDLPMMFKAYTSNAAYALGEERRLGSIEATKRADIVILNRKLMPDDTLDGVKVAATIGGGKVLYGDDALK